MQYYLFHPTLNAALKDHSELLSQFTCIDDSPLEVTDRGVRKTKDALDDGHVAPLYHLIPGFTSTKLDPSYNHVIKKVIDCFGKDLKAKTPEDKGKLSMVTFLLVMGKYDIIDQIIHPPVISSLECDGC
ncbi:hypothetical protein D3C76_154620 [compost metagenome]